MVEFGLVDIGAPRKTGPGGMLKEDAGKPWFTLIDIPFLRRLAIHMTKGAQKYGPDNWRLATSLEEQRGFQDSAWRHLLAWIEGQDDEDHAAAVVANIMMAEGTKENCG